MNAFGKNKKRTDDHEEIERRLQLMEKITREHAVRLKALEIEAGIFKPHIKVGADT